MTEQLETQNNPALLLEKYHTLTPLLQRILQIRAILLHTRRKTDFMNCLIESDLKQDNKKLKVTKVYTLLNQLIEENFLLPDSNINPMITHAVACLATQGDVASSNIAAMQKAFPLVKIFNFEIDLNKEINLQSIHLAVYTNNIELFVNRSMQKFDYCAMVIEAFSSIFYESAIHMDWVKTRDPMIQAMLCCAKLQSFYQNCETMPPDYVIWREFYVQSDFDNLVLPSFMQSKFLQIDIAMQKTESVRKKCTMLSEKCFYQQEVLGTLAFLEQNYTVAMRHYENAIKLFARDLNKLSWFKANVHAILYILLLIHERIDNKAAKNIEVLKKTSKNHALANVLEAMLCLVQGNQVLAQNLWNKSNITAMPLLCLLIEWAAYLLKSEDELKKIPAAAIQDAILASFPWRSFFQVKPAWEYAIDQLQQIIVDKPTPSLPIENFKESKRLVWFIHPEKLLIEVAEQKAKKNGAWTDGKLIPLKRLFQLDKSLNFLTEHDKAVIKGLKREVFGWYNQENFYWDDEITFTALVNHPLLFFRENGVVHLELTKGELTLQVENVEEGYHVSLSHHRPTPGVFLEKETSNRYKVIPFSQDAVAMSKIISAKGITFPLHAKDKVLEIVQNAKDGIRVFSEIEDDNIPLVEADVTPYLHILPLREGLKMTLWVRPLGEEGPLCKIAQGQKNIVAGTQIKQKTVRDFNKETQHRDFLVKQCPTLLEFECEQQKDEWHIDEIALCLEILLELEEYKKHHPLIIEWPQGQTLKLKQSVGFSQFSLSIRKNQSWFEYEGNIALDDNQVLELRQVLSLLEEGHGRFVRLKDGQFIALAENFKKQLEELKTQSEENKIHMLGAGILRNIADQAAFTETDAAWQSQLQKLTSMQKHHPEVPSTMQADLRDYQLEGFRYLSRLAHWGIGACLADDMGLGKTVQTIALLLERAKEGPALIVAPTSVCFNWVEELSKFSPTLQVSILNQIPISDRTAAIQAMNKMDILICSYHLLHQIGEELCNKDWHIVVLDEAQAIKNVDTKRWKYATQLKSQCRIALTGTPIENHLGELWSIFRFLNPGLLGSLSSFQQRFSVPIERSRDVVARRTLKNIIAPYILRRIKSDVLEELPPKTEQTLLIESTQEEQAFYEAIRLKALERIQKLSKNPDNTKRFSILAEISRLRQACCHASLIDENMQLESSKTKTFITLIKNLKENNHKTLVFSQYVRYLSKIKGILESEGITYQYLDGATPVKNRRTAVEAFQAGEGDVFLISLKAGGTGLNLTAADYVIILDPWWNPAVEDQASDRAHRIGQQRPVTVYRLMIKNTIEEKIIHLHKDKRNLASDLLSDGQMSGKITEEELIGLITG